MSRCRDAAIAEIAAGYHGIFARVHAREAGFTPDQIRRRLERGEWERLYDLAYKIAGAPPTWRGRLLAACWAGGFRAAASHRSAAALWDLAGRRRGVAEIICPRWRRAQHEGLVVHESKGLEPIDLAEVDGIPVTSPERTLLDLGAVCSPSVVEMALDAAERRGLVTLSSVGATLTRLARSGRNGVRSLRTLLDAKSPDRAVPDSEMETMMLQVLRRNGLPEPVPQFEIRVGGRFVARVDAAYPEHRIALEYDSYQEHAGRLAHDRDTGRRARIIAVGWIPIAVTAADLREGGPQLCAAIRGARRS
ncbi:MAG: hypothetical protein ACRDY4_16165 [Acidimicrobiia bacterium]